MMPTVHIRSMEEGFWTLCGRGSNYPNTVLVEKLNLNATCTECIRLAQMGR